MPHTLQNSQRLLWPNNFPELMVRCLAPFPPPANAPHELEGLAVGICELGVLDLYCDLGVAGEEEDRDQFAVDQYLGRVEVFVGDEAVFSGLAAGEDFLAFVGYHALAYVVLFQLLDEPPAEDGLGTKERLLLDAHPQMHNLGVFLEYFEDVEEGLPDCVLSLIYLDNDIGVGFHHHILELRD